MNLRCIGLDAKDYQSYKLSPKIQFLPYVSEAELKQQYMEAKALLFTSLAEGFGLPALEAQANACPVLASDLNVTREVLGQSAQFLPALALSNDEITQDLQQFSPERQKLLTLWLNACRESEIRSDKNLKGQSWAQKFSWQASAQQIKHIFEDVQIELQTKKCASSCQGLARCA